MAALAIGLAVSVFGTKIFELRPPVGSQLRTHPNVRVASAEAELDSYATADEEAAQVEASTSTTHYASFDQRYASFDQRSASFDERFAFSLDRRPSEADESVLFGAPVSPMPLASTSEGGLRSFASPTELEVYSELPPGAAKPDTRPPAGGRPVPDAAMLTPPPHPAISKEAVRAAETPNGSLSLPDANSHTAIYDIAAHAVYLPNGDKLEAHSGFGGNLDNPRYVNVKSRGPTPPNVYDLVLRKQRFHGVRALRLIPVDEGKMFGRDGILAHSYMLGPNGQSNGCVSFSNYPAFLSAFLKGDVDRLVVVDHLATAPSRKGGPEWLSEILRNLFGSS